MIQQGMSEQFLYLEADNFSMLINTFCDNLQDCYSNC